MNYFRAILSGLIVWCCIAVSFTVLEHIPFIRESQNTQAFLASFLIIPYAILGASFYYKKENKTSGLRLGLIMSCTAILMDAIVFVPLVEIPKGNSYQDFFTNPLLWILAFLNAMTVFLYWKFRYKIRK
ncbi:DUF5367 family protein [Flavobacterium foetidum]|uniref:DUF5367 family protein n=1 Tax=Flavobacterium foetidum TaxID=2026681 RepID=UPI001074E293|nr:DUF5367 family protein [Flavobacterium foetidum]KAF2517008.1 DUF5367 domain-containing protein [Flavobacterium foetidum]